MMLSRPWLSPRWLAPLALLALLLAGPGARLGAGEPGQPARLDIRPHDHVSILGNTLADRMQHDGWLETLFHARFPRHRLSVRNLGFSGDEVGGYTERPDFHKRLRSASFGTGDAWLEKTKADVVF